jgi:hypothetical protein
VINKITSNSPHLTVITSSPYVAPTSNYGALNVGQMRYNVSTQIVEVYDGSSWQAVASHATVDLNMSATEAIMWAQNKMHEEKKLKELMEKHPGLKESYERFEIMKTLVMEEENVPKK